MLASDNYTVLRLSAFDYTCGGVWVVYGEAFDADACAARYFCAELYESAACGDITFYASFPQSIDDLTADYDADICGSYAEGTEEAKRFWLEIFAHEAAHPHDGGADAYLPRFLPLLRNGKKGEANVLCGETAHDLREGDFLRLSSELYYVSAKLDVVNRYGGLMGYRVTVRGLDRRPIYLTKLSDFYGADIVRVWHDLASGEAAID